MTEVFSPLPDSARRFHFDLVVPILLRPRQALIKITRLASAAWLTPLLILSVTMLMQVLAVGMVKQSSAARGITQMPPDYQYYTPEQKAQYEQAQAATSSPIFVYVFPALVGLSQVWIGWLVVGGLLHLVLTLLGGRGDTLHAMNLVAWASLPFAVRDLVRFLYILFTRELIKSAGLSGFVATSGSQSTLFFAALSGLLDIYLVWYVVLLILGVRLDNGLPPAKAIGGVALTLLVVLLFEAFLGYGAARLGGLSIIRPFI